MTLENQELAVELLNDVGIVVVVANHGGEALEFLAAQSFDIVLMDCQMPEVDGYEATRRIRRNPRWANLPVIAMTANAMSGDRELAISSGMNDHIAKPIDVIAMYRTLERWAAEPPRAAERTAPLHVDLVRGFAGTGGNEPLYWRLVQRFCDSNAGAAAEFHGELARNDRVSLRRRSHDLYAVAGTLGAAELQRIARVLDDACEAGGADADIRRALDDVLRELASVLDEFKQHLRAANAPKL